MKPIINCTPSFWNVLSSLVLVFFILIGINLHASQESEAAKCSTELDNLKGKSSNLSAALVSMDTLLISEGSADSPLAVLFQVDLKDEDAVAKKIAELSALANENEVLSQVEYKVFRSCATDAKQIGLLSGTAKKQAQLNSKKLSFLKRDKSERSSLIATYEAARQQDQDHQQIETQLSSSKESLGQAQASLIQSEKSISTDSRFSDEELISARSLLEKFLVNIETEHIEFITSIRSERENLNDLRKQLSNHAGLDASINKIDNEFYAVDTIWRTAAKGLLSAFTKIDVASHSTLPEVLEKSIVNEVEQEKFRDYFTLYLKAKQRLNEISEQKQQLLFDFRALNFRLVNDSGRLRARLMDRCKATRSCENIGGFNENTISGVVTELRILPLKLLGGSFNKIVEFNAKMKGGLESWADIARQAFILIVLLLLPFLAHKFLIWMSQKLDRLREKVLARSILNYRRRTQAAIWISRLNPFVPPIGMIASIHMARALIESTDLQELSNVLFYLEIYFIYKAIRLLFKISIEILFSSEALEQSNDLSQRAEDSARRLSRFFFARYVALHIVEDTLRRALVYGIAYEVLAWASFIIVINEIRYWHAEILKSFEERFPSAWPKVRPAAEGYLRVFAFPILLFFVVGHDLFKWTLLRLVKINFFKRLFSEVFRRKLEREPDLSKPLKAPDAKYLSVFDYYLPADKEFYIDREPIVSKKILKTINSWLDDHISEDLVILVGNRGLGKTTCVKMIFDHLETENKYFGWIAPKIYSSEELFIWLSEKIGKEIKSLGDFTSFDADLKEKIVIIVDDIHNLFVGKIGGFTAYRQFMEIIGLKTTKIFWCLTVNAHAWTYLKGVFGREHFYGDVYTMRMWKDSEIQSMILARHKLTGYARSFDKSISAYGTSNVLGEKVETQFFRLLWGQSRGNPRSALMYWISAASQTSESEIHIGIPKFISTSTIGTMSNDALIVLAAISKHDSLTIDELTYVTQISSLVVRKIVRESGEKELLWTDEQGRIRILSRSQNAIDYYLMGKKFLYE